MAESTAKPDNAETAPTKSEEPNTETIPITVTFKEITAKKSSSSRPAAKKSHRLLVRVILNARGYDYLDHGKKDLDVVGLKDTSDYWAICQDICSHYHRGAAPIEKVLYRTGCALMDMVILWDGQDDKTKLTTKNCKDVLKMVNLRKGRDVLQAVFDEMDDSDYYGEGGESEGGDGEPDF